MLAWLRQATATTVKIGPFLDSTDGNTVEGGLTISQADVRLSKNGGDFAQKGDATACSHDELGYYDCPLNTTDTGTLGRLRLAVHEGGALPVWHDFMVVPANVWDSLFGNDYLDVNVKQVSEDTTAADNWEAILDGTGGVVLKLAQLLIQATGNNSAIDVTGAGGGSGIIATAGASGTAGIYATGPGGSNAMGIYAAGQGSGSGLGAYGGASGHGILGQGGITNGDGMRLVGDNGGKDLNLTTPSSNGLATAALGTDIALIKAKTDNLPALPAAVGSAMTLADNAITNAKFTTAGLNAIADAILKRDWTAVTGEAARSVLNALRFLRNKWNVSSGTLTVRKEDDSTVAWTAGTSDTAGADPITGVDPT